jgi:hypothetical protein
MRIINADLLMLEIRSLVQKACDAGRKRGREEAMHESQNVMGSFDDVDFEVDDGTAPSGRRGSSSGMAIPNRLKSSACA